MTPETAQKAYEPSRCNYIFACSITADGKFPLGPKGWTVEKLRTGVYKIVHNLGHKDYVILPVVWGEHKVVLVLLDVDETSVTLSTSDKGVQEDAASTVILFSAQ